MMEDTESVSEAINSGMLVSLDLPQTDDQVTEDTGTMHVVELQCDTNIFMDNFTLPVEEYGLAKQDDIDSSSFTELKNHGHGEDNIITLWHVNSDFEFEVSIEA